MHSPPTRLEREALARGRFRLIRKMRAMPHRCGNMDFFKLLQLVKSIGRQRNETCVCSFKPHRACDLCNAQNTGSSSSGPRLRKMFDAVD
jgi:hypothetical protein